MRKDSPLLKLRHVIDKEWYNHLGDIEGKILTVVDSSVSDPIQRKAMKDIVRQAMHGWPNYYLQRIGRALLEFNTKFAKIEIGEKEEAFFKSGEWVPGPGEPAPVDPEFFPS